MKFSIGDSERERIEVDVSSYARPAAGDYYDDTWLTVSVVVHAGGFSGHIRAAFLTDELVRFATLGGDRASEGSLATVISVVLLLLGAYLIWLAFFGNSSGP